MSPKHGQISGENFSTVAFEKVAKTIVYIFLWFSIVMTILLLNEDVLDEYAHFPVLYELKSCKTILFGAPIVMTDIGS